MGDSAALKTWADSVMGLNTHNVDDFENNSPANESFQFDLENILLAVQLVISFFFAFFTYSNHSSTIGEKTSVLAGELLTGNRCCVPVAYPVAFFSGQIVLTGRVERIQSVKFKSTSPIIVKFKFHAVRDKSENRKGRLKK